MRILMLSPTPSNYKSTHGQASGGGWIGALEKELIRYPDIELGIAFEMDNEQFKTVQDAVTYYPIKPYKEDKLMKHIYTFSSNSLRWEKKQWRKQINGFISVVNDFKPEIIHIFGSEKHYGLIACYTKIPVILHIQGVLNPYMNAFLPPFMSWGTYMYSYNIKNIYKRYMTKKAWERNAYREKEIIGNIQHYLGRTEWDHRVTEVMAPDATYHYCGELLREQFYQQPERILPQTLTIVSIVSAPIYKGFDFILKTAYLLKTAFHIDFIWNVYGNEQFDTFEKLLGIRCEDVNIHKCGLATASQLKVALENATLYFHAAYIENSPNSLSEAQITGCPVVATDVGGISTLIKDGINGFLIPSNDTYQAVSLIKRLYEDYALNEKIGMYGRDEAITRHNKKQVISDLLTAYNDIVMKTNTVS